MTQQITPPAGLDYAGYIAWCQKQQRKYITSERERYKKAKALWKNYDAAMRALGLHPLTLLEIDDRQRQLDRMWLMVHETHGDHPSMRMCFDPCLSA